MQWFLKVLRQNKILTFVCAVLLASNFPSSVNAQALSLPSAHRIEFIGAQNSDKQSPDTQIVSTTTASILSEVLRKMEPALEDSLTYPYSQDKLSSTREKLMQKYRLKKMTIKEVFSDDKLFVVIKLMGKRFCYRATTPGNRIKLVKSTRCA
jgi:hypothetical protein